MAAVLAYVKLITLPAQKGTRHPGNCRVPLLFCILTGHTSSFAAKNEGEIQCQDFMANQWVVDNKMNSARASKAKTYIIRMPLKIIWMSYADH